MKLLEGLRVISVEQFGAAPYGTMFLADLGAEVIKVENQAIGGDPARYTGPFALGDADSEYFQTWNSNKKSITLNLASAEGRESLLALIAAADALVNNLRGDLPAKMGLNFDALAAINPKLVCLHISAYGRDNDRSSWPGYDYLMQAESGLMDLTGEPDSPPSRIGAPSMIDHMTGATGMIGLLSAIIHARASGVGCDVDTSLFDVALHQLGYAAIWNLNEQHSVTRQPRSAHFSLTPVQTFPTADGWIFIMCMTDKFWKALVDCLGNPPELADAKFNLAAARQSSRAELTGLLDGFFKAHSTQHWLSVLQGELPVAPVLSVAQALENPFLQQTEMISTVPHTQKPEFRMLSIPIKVNGSRPAQKSCSALGADNSALFLETSRR